MKRAAFATRGSSYGVCLLSLCVACSERTPRFASYAPLKCSTLQIPFHGQRSREFSWDAPAADDKTLGWVRKTAAAAHCDTAEETDFHYCESYRRSTRRYTPLQESPLDDLGASDAFRAIYEHSFGITVLVRVVRTEEGADLVAKVLNWHEGPWAWIKSRRLSEAEWGRLKSGAASLPEGMHEYFPRSEEDAKRGVVLHPGCYIVDGVSVRVERLEHGVLNVATSAYFSPGERCYPGTCCSGGSNANSRFFDELVNLVQCSKPESH